MKEIEPGFISGYNDQQVAKIIDDAIIRFQLDENSVYSYDGGSHDAH